MKRHTKSFANLAVTCLALLALISPQAFAAELFGPMKGLYWMAGTLERTSKEILLQQTEQVLAQNEYLSGLFLLERWTDLEPEAGRYKAQLQKEDTYHAPGTVPSPINSKKSP